MKAIVTISANTLFHFTNSLENLIGILTNNFYPRYCLEDHSYFYTQYMKNGMNQNEMAIPIICFCDIPLSNIRSHVSTYGNYAIGLSKDWGIKNRINPVMYILSNSIPVGIIRHSLPAISKSIAKSNEHFSVLYKKYKSNKWDKKDYLIDFLSTELAKDYNAMLEMMTFTKPYKGTFFRNGKRYRNVCFYDEREWRYVANTHLLFEDGIPSYIRSDEWRDADIRREYNKKLERPVYTLTFSPSDIKYIVVAKSQEILPMIDSILRINGEKYSEDDLKLLTTRIISMEDILNDF
jgi:hypothetical protein